jgi:site-specific DNA recombinase
MPALVSQETFDRVQARLALNKQQAPRHNKAHRYVLRALVSMPCAHDEARTSLGRVPWCRPTHLLAA